MKKRKKKEKNNYGAMTIEKRGVKKVHMLLSMCKNTVNKECILGFWAALDAMALSFWPNSTLVVIFEQILKSPFVLVLEKKKGIWKLVVGLHGCSHRVLWWRKGKILVPLLSCIELCSYLQQGSSILSSFSLIKIWWHDGCIHMLKYQVIIFVWLCFIGALVGCWWF